MFVCRPHTLTITHKNGATICRDNDIHSNGRNAVRIQRRIGGRPEVSSRHPGSMRRYVFSRRNARTRVCSQSNTRGQKSVSCLHESQLKWVTIILLLYWRLFSRGERERDRRQYYTVKSFTCPFTGVKGLLTRNLSTDLNNLSERRFWVCQLNRIDDVWRHINH